jgi:2-oxoglutarate ferredoxin oxidoreductase subunit delta
MEKFELKANEEALARRAKRKPFPKRNKITVVPVYCKGCSLCVDVCPTGTLLLEDDPANKFGVSIKVDAEEYCIGCKMCEDRCPDFAIFVNYEDNENENVNDEEGKQ